MINESLLDYEQILLGQKKTFSSNKNYEEDNTVVNTTAYEQKIALDIIRYSLENILDWTPEQIYTNLTPEILEKLKLKPLIKKIKFPVELDSEKDLFYIACLLYPNKYQINFKELCVYLYEKILKNKISKLPKGFFALKDGEYRGILCLRYAVNKFLNFKNINEYYDFFASPKANNFLREKRLIAACELHFLSPLDYAHKALLPYQRNNAIYLYYKFSNEFSKKVSEK